MVISRIMMRLGRQAGVVVVVVVLAVVAVAAVSMTMSSAGPDRKPVAGVAIPENQLAALVEGAESCPALTPARLAGQVMEQSKFDTTAARGVADLSNKAWKKWRPWQGAERSDPKASILALAHLTCDLVGRARGSQLTGDLWLPAVAAFHSGMPKVVKVKGVPDRAAAYTDRVESYAKWYALHKGFGAVDGAPEAAPEDSPTSPSPSPSKESPSPSAKPRAPDTEAPRKTETFWNPEFHGCLSATAARDGTHLSMTKCDKSDVQRWQLRSDGTIRSVGLCMDAANASTADFTVVQVARCSGHPAQQFTYLPDQNKIYSPYADKCVNVDFRKGEGTRIVIFQCRTQPNQVFEYGRP